MNARWMMSITLGLALAGLMTPTWADPAWVLWVAVDGGPQPIALRPLGGEPTKAGCEQMRQGYVERLTTEMSTHRALMERRGDLILWITDPAEGWERVVTLQCLPDAVDPRPRR